eukprot:TRINITY_DN13134_c0_g1_i1.p1 TRINITY_DN13134_c0_g1~~TRINITY_DN13134_c0_g1_i1.p1  ORF type:complete len:103 (-),score=50.82 TRINITY_DN13134_c0_g1_i1:117-425(-)
MIRRPPRSTQSRSSAASDVYKRQSRDSPVDALPSLSMLQPQLSTQLSRAHYVTVRASTGCLELYHHSQGEALLWFVALHCSCLLYTSPSPRDRTRSRMPSSA